MSLYRNLYFMSLAGGIAGLCAWALTMLLTAVSSATGAWWLSDFQSATLLGAFIGGMTVGFSDHWSGNRVRPRFVISGCAIGACAGLLASALQIPLSTNLRANAPGLTRVTAWMLAGALIGFGLGLRWIGVNRMRPIHAFVGGLIGGAIGGMLFWALGSRVPDLTQAMGFICIGVGISAGVTLAPILLRDGLLRFISSGDARAQGKFGSVSKEWEVQNGDSYVIGSESLDRSSTRFQPEVEIFIPDAAIALRHATLFGREGRFFVARHPDVSSEVGLAKYVLKVRGRTVVNSSEVRDKDDILIGRTALRFHAKEQNGRSA